METDVFFILPLVMAWLQQKTQAFRKSFVEAYYGQDNDYKTFNPLDVA
jgi:hypothetical protein